MHGDLREMDQTHLDVYALGQAIDTTWGRSSTPKSSSYSVKMTLSGDDTIVFMYTTIVKFTNQCDMILLKRAYAEEADKATNLSIKRVKDIYNELTGKSVTLKAIKDSVNDSLEVIAYNAYAPSRSALFRRKVLVQVALCQQLLHQRQITLERY